MKLGRQRRTKAGPSAERPRGDSRKDKLLCSALLAHLLPLLPPDRQIPITRHRKPHFRTSKSQLFARGLTCQLFAPPAWLRFANCPSLAYLLHSRSEVSQKQKKSTCGQLLRLMPGVPACPPTCGVRSTSQTTQPREPAPSHKLLSACILLPLFTWLKPH